MQNFELKTGMHLKNNGRTSNRVKKHRNRNLSQKQTEIAYLLIESLDTFQMRKQANLKESNKKQAEREKNRNCS